MRQIIFLIVSFLFTVPIFGQNHSVNFDRMTDFSNFYLFPDIKNETTYSFELKGSSLTKKKLTEFNVLNIKTQQTEKQVLKSSLSFQGKFLRAYYHEGNFVFLNHDIINNKVVITKMSTAKEMAQEVINVPLQEGEKVYITHHRNDQIFVLSKQFKSRLMTVHFVSLSDGKVSRASHVLERPDSRAFSSQFVNPAGHNGIVSRIIPPKVIDYTKHNHLLDFVGNEKIFIDKDEVVLLIEHMGTYIISLYKFNIATGETSFSRYKTTQTNGWNSFNATYYNKMLYRIMSNYKGTYFDIINTETEETTFSRSYTKKSDYPFDFQVSNFVNQDKVILEDKKSLVRKLGSASLFVYPEINENAVNIYVGNISTPKYDGLRPISKQLQLGGYLSPFIYKEYNYNLYDKPVANLLFSETSIEYMLAEINIDKNGQPQKDKVFKETPVPNYLQCSLAVKNIQKQTTSLDVAIHRFEGSYYGVFYKKTEKKIFVKKLTL